MAGYSGTPLGKKLGIKADHQVCLVDSPLDFASTLVGLPDGVVVANDAQDGPFDVIVFFSKSQLQLEQRFRSLANVLVANGGLWIAWPKKSSGVVTDLSEDSVRSVGLAAGLVDNKVCAIDNTWSGLRFVVRVQDRPRKKRK